MSTKLDKLSTDFKGHLNDALKAIIDSKTPYVATGGSIIKDVERKDTMLDADTDLSWTGFKWNQDKTRVDGTEN